MGKRDREREREKHREMSIDCFHICDQTWDRTPHLRVCPEWELNPPYFSVQDNAPIT